ncbi:inositol monophosphatase family protein [Rhizobium rhizogenes]|uniref:Inositol-1-monophosphatase n=1 Tax=Rhizobium rhizogenes NBRC 13257 TaxID=1220581 RepID=A0AA87U6Y3_RHIRH|nr:inositol monophosphatase family protein [Rhizobium rhizogenes]NTG71375.1 inositol monophosphatase [Rhizobium rhizogenes]TRB05218.1 inositol monophosphatase [Rhizobium rhizogenes]TRB39361.1 inositol monophosphatase [Rhizobium rhizogenes]TRB54753.1 inositol monophosphatase [Rhizobium rhizogenes]GAJ95545.1 inositol-1-monophosphatase [Rhizobium rhizogenes NBRC 13257]
MADTNGSNPSERAVEAVVEEIARKAGELALIHFRSLSNLPVEKKGHLDLVTKADKDVEEFLIANLRAAFPDDGIFGEEGGEIKGTSGRTWVIDPIDGTFNFVRGGQNWAISIGLYENRRPVFGVIYAPVRQLMLAGGQSVETRLNGKPMPALPALDLSQASMGIGLHPSVATDDRLEVVRFISDDLRISFRCCGSATLSLIEVAMGETDGYVSLGDSTWDVMAGLPILANLGVSHTIDWDRIDLAAKLRFACGSNDFLEKVRPLLEKVAVAA